MHKSDKRMMRRQSHSNCGDIAAFPYVRFALGMTLSAFFSYRTLENVVVTPHLAGSSYENVLKGAAFANENIHRVMAGQPPESVVTPYY